jgi:hypothetical protein
MVLVSVRSAVLVVSVLVAAFCPECKPWTGTAAVIGDGRGVSYARRALFR